MPFPVAGHVAAAAAPKLGIGKLIAAGAKGLGMAGAAGITSGLTAGLSGAVQNRVGNAVGGEFTPYAGGASQAIASEARRSIAAADNLQQSKQIRAQMTEGDKNRQNNIDVTAMQLASAERRESARLKQELMLAEMFDHAPGPPSPERTQLGEQWNRFLGGTVVPGFESVNEGVDKARHFWDRAKEGAGELWDNTLEYFKRR